MLDEPDASLFVIAPNTGTVAGAAVALIDSIIRHFRKRTAQHQMEHRLLLELDEVCNSCPLPALLNYVGESAGLGVNIMATVQASSHFDVVYGPKYADALRDIFPGTVVMYGAHERHLLEQASHWSGLATRRSESYEPNGGSRSQSSQFGASIDWQELLPQNVEEAQLLLRGTPGRRVQIPDWSQFLAIYDQAITARRARIPA
jgi:type IV secretion system protein VirD4